MYMYNMYLCMYVCKYVCIAYICMYSVYIALCVGGSKEMEALYIRQSACG